MKRKKRIIRMLAAVLAASVLGSWGVPARAAGPAQVIVTVDGADVTPLAGARRVGTNIEMSMISDAMWQANGNWMEQSFFAGELDMMRWGYDAGGLPPGPFPGNSNRPFGPPGPGAGSPAATRPGASACGSSSAFASSRTSCPSS